MVFSKNKILLIKTYSLEGVILVFLVLFGLQISLSPSFAEDSYQDVSVSEQKALDLMITAMQNQSRSSGVLPVSREKENPRRIMRVVATAYSSTEDQTDSTPFITASNTTVRSGIIANNDLPFGTKVKIPDLYGDNVFVVEDRMNRRYTGKNRIDVWMLERADAKNFGVREVVLEVY